MLNQSARRWMLLCAIVLAVILVPFFLFGEQIESWTQDFLDAASDRPLWIGVVLAALLASDVLVPVPSSLASTAAGLFVGFVGGAVASLTGMTISCALGYWLGVQFGRPAANRLVGEGELARLQKLNQRLGDWVIVVSRPVPVLAEASILFAGISQMPLRRFLLLCTLSNLGVSVVYAAVGAFSASVNSFLLAFAGAILVPLAGMMLMRNEK